MFNILTNISSNFFTIQTPALLFPTISLLMLAYTNRFFGITGVIRKLHADMVQDPENHDFNFPQIQSLNQRIKLILFAQKTGIVALLSCVLSMIFAFFEINTSIVLFAIALCALSASLIAIYKELSVSQEALAYILNDCVRINKERNVKKEVQ